jgi:hypothetical protein
MKTLQTLTVVWLAAAVGATPLVSANAAPSFVPQAMQDARQSDVIHIRDGVRWRRGYRNYGPRYRYRNDWYPAGAFVAGALIGGAIANSYDYEPYYGDRYYSGYYREPYYQRRVYQVAPGSSYRQGYRDGYRAGRSDRYYGGYPCSPRLADAGRC